MSIVFGKEEATEPVIGEVITTGVLDRVLVVNNIAITLISETSLTKRGVIFLKNDTTLIGLLDSRIVVMGRRDTNAKEGSVDQLWNIDLRSLFRQPGFDNKEGVSVLTKKDRENKNMYVTLQAFLGENGSTQDGMVHAFSARPKYTQLQTRTARNMIRNCNNMSAETIARTIDAGAWSNIPTIVDGSLFRDIGNRRDNIGYLLSNTQKVHAGGTGIRSTIPGEVVHMDIQWKTKTDRGTNATFVVIFVCECCLFGLGFAVVKKSNTKDAFMLWRRQIRAWGQVSLY
jgi:hypothetical protein